MERRATVLWLLVALAVFGGFTLASRLRAPAPPPAPSWQRPVSELSPAQQQFHAHLREQLRAAEGERGRAKSWPASTTDGWPRRQQGIYVNYVGEAEGLRWLGLFIEPDPRLPSEKPPPEDAEHHTLSDGTALHVTVWTQPLSEPKSELVTAFPAAEGWVERVQR